LRATVKVVEEAKWGQVQLNSDAAWVYISRWRPGEAQKRVAAAVWRVGVEVGIGETRRAYLYKCGGVVL
jgi:hypothetical protein